MQGLLYVVEDVDGVGGRICCDAFQVPVFSVAIVKMEYGRWAVV